MLQWVRNLTSVPIISFLFLFLCVSMCMLPLFFFSLSARVLHVFLSLLFFCVFIAIEMVESPLLPSTFSFSLSLPPFPNLQSCFLYLFFLILVNKNISSPSLAPRKGIQNQNCNGLDDMDAESLFDIWTKKKQQKLVSKQAKNKKETMHEYKLCKKKKNEERQLLFFKFGFRYWSISPITNDRHSVSNIQSHNERPPNKAAWLGGCCGCCCCGCCKDVWGGASWWNGEIGWWCWALGDAWLENWWKLISFIVLAPLIEGESGPEGKNPLPTPRLARRL